MRARSVFCLTATAIWMWGCGRSDPPTASATVQRKPEHVKITQFYAAAATIPRGTSGNLCYGVENAVRLELDPSVEKLWPSAARCFEVSPKVKTSYTLSAYGEDGSSEKKTIEQQVGAPLPRLYDLWVNSIDVAHGEEVRICFKLENVRSVKVSPGRLDSSGRCMTDRPAKTTTYKITALGGDRDLDNGTVTVKVH